MINLPKPSPLSMKGSPSEQISYIIRYLQLLVSSLEKLLSAGNKSSNDNPLTVSDISFSDGEMKIIYSNGSVKHIDFEN
ncbi:MAG: hypothetical protein IJ927_04985 [Eubacterium sp.]|jgi:hypothetical protein|nr:hypothetical protein [Eubacterium sp.]